MSFHNFFYQGRDTGKLYSTFKIHLNCLFVCGIKYCGISAAVFQRIIPLQHQRIQACVGNIQGRRLHLKPRIKCSKFRRSQGVCVRQKIGDGRIQYRARTSGHRTKIRTGVDVGRIHAAVGDHIVRALRQAEMETNVLTGPALEIQQKVNALAVQVKDDQAAVDGLNAQAAAAAKRGGTPAASLGDDLDVAKARLQLDTDERNDASDDLARASGDKQTQIQQGLAAREASMQKYDSQANNAGEPAAISVKRYGTLAGRIGGWRCGSGWRGGRCGLRRGGGSCHLGGGRRGNGGGQWRATDGHQRWDHGRRGNRGRLRRTGR